MKKEIVKFSEKEIKKIIKQIFGQREIVKGIENGKNFFAFHSKGGYRGIKTIDALKEKALKIGFVESAILENNIQEEGAILCGHKQFFKKNNLVIISTRSFGRTKETNHFSFSIFEY